METPTASPFASSLLFDYVATYMYEGDTPNAERRAAALSLDRELLRELLGQEELRELIDPEALAEVEDSLQHRAELARAKDRDALQQILRRLGDLTPAECQERVAEGYSADSMLEKLERERRAARVRVAGEERWIAAEDAALYRDALGVPPPAGLPETFLAEAARRDGGPGSPLRAHPRALPHRHSSPAATAPILRPRCASWSGPASWCAESCSPAAASASGAIRRCCAACGGRASPTCAPRRRPSTRASWRASCRAGRTSTPAGPRAPAPTGCARRWCRCKGVALTPEVWERDVLPRRLGAYSPAWLDELCTGGELVWIGAGALGRSGGKVALYFREDVRLAGPPPANLKLEPAAGRCPRRDPRAARPSVPCFWLDLVSELDLDAEELHTALWDLAWGGEVTNDAFAPLRAPRLRSLQRERQRRGRRFAARRGAAGQAVQGRWSLTAPLFQNAPSAGPRLRAQAELMLERYGIVTRETVLAEGVPGGFASLYGEMSNLEMLGTARRGYFVEGLGGAQFALPGAVERLRSLPSPDGRYLVLAATDPANPYGAGVPWPKRDGGAGGRRPSRTPGAYVLLRDGEPLLFVERGGRGILRLRELEGEALAEAVGELGARRPGGAACRGWRSSASTASR